MSAPRLVRRFLLAATLAVTGVAAMAPSASADFHFIKIREITGDTAGGNAAYIELQMYDPGQTNLANHELSFWDSDGQVLGVPQPVAEIPITGLPVPNGQNQRTILIGDTATPNRDYTVELSPFLEAGGVDPIQENGAACFEAIPIDCVSWGASFTGANNLPDKTTPQGTVLSTGLLAFRRIITGGTCATALDPGDDTNTAADFTQVSAGPTPNSATPTETLCTQNGGPGTTPKKKKKCKKKKGKGKAGGAAKKKKCKKKKKKK